MAKSSTPLVDIRFSNGYKGSNVNGTFVLDIDRLGNYIPTTTIKVSGSAEAFNVTGMLPSIIDAKMIAKFAKDYADSREDGKTLHYQPDTDYRRVSIKDFEAKEDKPASKLVILKPNPPAVPAGKGYFSK